MKDVNEASFMAESDLDSLRAIGRAKHERLSTDKLEALVLKMLEDAKNDTIPADLRPQPGVVEEKVYALFAGAAFEVLIRKLMEQNEG